MKSSFLTVIFFLAAQNFLFAQKENFDMVTYKPIEGWKKERTDKVVSFSSTDEVKGTFCAISIYPSTNGDENSKTNFDNSWQKIVQEILGADKPKMEVPVTKNQWEFQTGSAQFNKDGLAGIAMLVTATSNNKMVNILVLRNADTYITQLNNFIGSIELQQTQAPAANTNTAGNTSNGSIAGLWTNYILETTGYNVGGMPQYTAGYLRKEYRFNADGTYIFRNKQWLTKAADIIFVYETGTYTINGNQLTLTPQSGKSSFWEKKKSTKEWGKLKKDAAYKLEKINYVFELTTDPIYGNKIILKPERATVRDGGQFNAPGDPYEFRYSFRELESLIDNPPGFKL